LAAPGTHTLVFKRAIGFSAAALLHPDEASDRIEQEVPKSLADREAIQPPRFDGSVLLEVDVLRSHMTERALLIPGIEPAGGCTLRYRAPDFPTVYRVTQLIIMLGGI
jgi:D-amino peptidase